MSRPYRLIAVERRGDVCCVRLRLARMDEAEVYELANELLALADEGCPKVALSLGPDGPACMYSVFLAKLMTVQRVFGERGGELVLCEVSPVTRTAFAASRLDEKFQFLPDFDAAVAHFAG
jgi:anti-anti-sigma regulatory factor